MAHRSDWVYQKSSDDGRARRPPVSALTHKVQEANPTVYNSWYAWFGKGHGETIRPRIFTPPCADPGHSNDRFNTHYVKFNGKDDSWENPVGEKLTGSVTKDYADRKTLMLNTGAERCSHGTCRVGQRSSTQVIFRDGKGEVRSSRLTGRAWAGRTAGLPGGVSSDGDMIVESPSTARTTLAGRNGNKGEVGFWNATDCGQTRTKERGNRSGGARDFHHRVHAAHFHGGVDRCRLTGLQRDSGKEGDALPRLAEPKRRHVP